MLPLKPVVCQFVLTGIQYVLMAYSGIKIVPSSPCSEKSTAKMLVSEYHRN